MTTPRGACSRRGARSVTNSTDWAGGLAFDTMQPDTIVQDAEVWEKAIRKLRGRLMPPPGETQPDQPTIDRFVSWMEGQLDHAAATNPDPGQRRAASPEPHGVRARGRAHPRTRTST